MITNKKSTRLHIYSLVLMILALQFLFGCDEKLPLQNTQLDNQPSILIDGFEIPNLPDPKRQFLYSRSVVDDHARKRSALQAVCRLFPDAGKYCGMAALDIAYLQLGDDYRFSDRQESMAALGEYDKILQKYRQHPEVAARAMWYTGWIYCDLLAENDTGISYFLKVVKRYGDITMGVEPDFPEVHSLFPGEHKTTAPLYSRTKNYWATAALVEIVKNSMDGAEIKWALDTLSTHYDNLIATGIAITVVLRNDKLPPGSRDLIDDFLNNEQADYYQKRDIRLALAALNRNSVQ